jgi:hypothetical protein
LAGTAEPLPASSRTQEVNVAAAASVAIQKDLMNLNMWGVLFASIYPRKPPTFESSNLISSAAKAAPEYSKLGILAANPRPRGETGPSPAQPVTDFAKRPKKEAAKPSFAAFRRHPDYQPHGMFTDVTTLFAAL